MKSRSHLWISGPNPVMHNYYKKWQQQRNQANYRKEGWEFTFDEWITKWGDDINNRGRTKLSKTMIRPDITKPWSKQNSEIVTREAHGRHQQELHRKKKCEQ
jgi:alpha-L-fucosidase